MVLIYFGYFIYALGTVMALSMSYIEGVRNGNTWDALRLIGLALCFLWPLMVVIMLIVLAATNLQERRIKDRRLTVRKRDQVPSSPHLPS